MPLLTLIRTALDPRWALHCGVVNTDGPGAFALVARHVDGRSRLLACGPAIAAFLRWLRPMVIHTDLGATPVRMVSDELQGTSVDQWVDANEERLTPRGLTSDQLVSEWVCESDRIYAATVTRKARDEAVAALQRDRYLVSSLSVPLWDLARLYWSAIKEPFLLWKLTAQGSVIAYVEQGCLRNVCSFWPRIADLAEQAEDVGQQAAGVCDNLSGKQAKKVVVVGDNAGQTLPELPNIEYLESPKVEGVPAGSHEAYALAMHSRCFLDFAPLSDVQEATSLHQRRTWSLRLAQGLSGLVLAALLVSGLAGLAVALTEAVTQKQLDPVRGRIEQLRSQQATVDSLSKLLARQGRFLERESMVTFLVTELQEVFPEGSWAEQVSVSEKDNNSYSLEIISMSSSTGDISTLLERLGKVAGVSDVRMLYSEQSGSSRREQKSTRLKVACVWSQQ